MLKSGIQASLVRGLEQWLWFLGVDTSDPHNNLLLRHGFVKFKPPGTRGSSCYRLVWRGNRIELHSFCVGVYPKGLDGFIFIRARHQCFLYTAPKPPIPGQYPEDSLISAESDDALRRLHAAASRFLGWLMEYERWVQDTYGSAYRSECYDAYHLKWQPPAAGLAWLNRFCRYPNLVPPVRPVVSTMTLLESNVDGTDAHTVKPPAPLKDKAHQPII